MSYLYLQEALQTSLKETSVTLSMTPPIFHIPSSNDIDLDLRLFLVDNKWIFLYPSEVYLLRALGTKSPIQLTTEIYKPKTVSSRSELTINDKVSERELVRE